ncbi:MAG: rod shape-determining protein MreC [Treponema sp.]|nr:rod shape-determining protein MreC [Treponema sp.]
MRKSGGLLKTRFSSAFWVFLSLTLVSLAALVVSTRENLDLRHTGFTILSGTRGAVDTVSSFVSSTVLAIGELAKLREEHDALLDRLARYEGLERTASEISQENQRLREQLGFADSVGVRNVPARIVARDPDNLFSAFVINKGRLAGLSRNMPVIAWQGGTQALVGKVIEARSFESLVLPLYDQDFSVSSRFATSRFEGIVEGQGGAEMALRMRFIPKRALEQISRGELVVSSGMGGIYPPDINIGRVSSIIYGAHEVSMEVEVLPLIDFARLEYVFVIQTIDREEPEDGYPEADLSGTGTAPAAENRP